MLIRKALETGSELPTRLPSARAWDQGLRVAEWNNVEQQAIFWQNKSLSQAVVDARWYTGQQRLPDKVRVEALFFFQKRDQEWGCWVFNVWNFEKDELTECQERELKGRCHVWAVGEIKRVEEAVLGVCCDRRGLRKSTASRKLLRPFLHPQIHRTHSEFKTRPAVLTYERRVNELRLMVQINMKSK